MNWQTFFNPFSKFEEKQLLIGGIFLTFLGTVIGFLCNASFDGVLDMHILEKTTFSKVAIENTINIATITILLFSLGKFFNSKTRFIDILNTSLWYRFPLYFSPILATLLLPKNLNEKLTKGANLLENQTELILTGIFAILTLLIIAYNITLLVYGFKTATNTKKWQHFALMGLTILIAEIVSKYIFFQFF